MARRNGRSYVVKGEIPKRYWEPSQGDVVYIEGTRTKLGRPYQDPDTGKTMFPLRPSVRGTTDMAAGNIKAIARVEAQENPEGLDESLAYTIGEFKIWPVAKRSGKYWKTVYEVHKSGRYLNEFGTLAKAKGFVARRRKEANPKRTFKVMTSFGGHLVGKFSSEAAARKKAASHGSKTPVDVWSTTGGAMGQGKVIAHYGPKAKINNPRVGLTYYMLYRYDAPSDQGKVSPHTLTGLFSNLAKAKLWAELEISRLGGVGYLYANTRKVATVKSLRTSNNPAAGVEAIPTRWTPTTISTRGGQVQLRIGGRR